jgi:hypothetical protein
MNSDRPSLKRAATSINYKALPPENGQENPSMPLKGKEFPSTPIFYLMKQKNPF